MRLKSGQLNRRFVMAKKSMKLGAGGRFAKLKGTLAKQGVEDPAALAATIGRKKFGKAKMTKWAAKGRAKRGCK
jgi:methyl coenzyme M reductase subunit C